MENTPTPNPQPWWQNAVFYQVYPRSFADSNGDGIGDLPGITNHLDYLQELGIDAIWLSPHYPSPQVDCGYDIADYTQVAPEYGTLADFKRFLQEAHRRHIRVVTDLVLNHTSDQHAWFQNSRLKRDHPYRDWYIWRKGRSGGPPNNWVSAFGGSAWELDSQTGEYYYHLFFKEQPDLNWRNPEVKKALWQAARFWLDLGVDGFRLDAIDTLCEHPDEPDHPVQILGDLRHHLLSASSEQRIEDGVQNLLFQYQVDQPENGAIIQELRALLDTYPERVLIGETDRAAFFGQYLDGVHMIFNFPLMNMGRLEATRVRANQIERWAELPEGAWLANTLGNHDRSRSLQAHSDGLHDQALARLSLALLLTLRGTPFLYYGEEIGMTNLYLDDLSQVRDNVSLWVYQAALESGASQAEALRRAVLLGRDRCRTPMQWSPASNAGFCPAEVRAWLPVNPDYARGVNVADQMDQTHSLLQDYRALLHLRRDTPALQRGEMRFLDTDTQVLTFLRRETSVDQTCLVFLNFSDQARPVETGLPAHAISCLFSTHRPLATLFQPNQVTLAPFEVLVGELRNWY